jgi:hypothetical protein
MCVCDPPCSQLDGNWPTEACPNPECTGATVVGPVGLTETFSGLGLTFHCGTCPCRWYSAYEFAGEARP